MSSPVWTETATVRGHEVTPDGTASIGALCMYLQEAAGHHADALNLSMQDLNEEGKAWVLSHFRLHVDEYPAWEEEVEIETWPSGLDGLRATREFVLRTGDRHLAAATSAWIVFDVESRRPARPPRRLFDVEPPDRAHVLAHDWDDLSHPDTPDVERTFEVRYHDLDVNRHANNLSILEWALETLPASFLDAHRCTALAMQFKAETTLGDTVRSVAQIDDRGGQTRARHALHHADDDRTLAVATTEWTCPQ